MSEVPATLTLQCSSRRREGFLDVEVCGDTFYLLPRLGIKLMTFGPPHEVRISITFKDKEGNHTDLKGWIESWRVIVTSYSHVDYWAKTINSQNFGLHIVTQCDEESTIAFKDLRLGMEQARDRFHKYWEFHFSGEGEAPNLVVDGTAEVAGRDGTTYYCPCPLTGSA